MRSVVCLLLAAGLVTAWACPSVAAERVGEAVLIKTSVTGGGGRTLISKSPVHRDERIRTSGTGLGEFVFRDGTRFAVGGNSSVVIDKFVFNDDSSIKNISVKAAKGSFRWISGGANSSAYKIATPAGTIGIRGTAFDVYVGPGGVTAVVLLQGSIQFCGSNGCREVRRRCDCVIATPRGGVSAPTRVNDNILRQLQNDRALPFMTGAQRLSGRFRVGPDCMAEAASASPNRSAPATPSSAPSATTPAPEPEPEPEPEPKPKDKHGKGKHGKGHHGKGDHGKGGHDKGGHDRGDRGGRDKGGKGWGGG